MKKNVFTIVLSIMLFISYSNGKAQFLEANLLTKAHRDKISQALAELSKSTLNVVIVDEQTKEGQTMMKAFDKYWKYSKYKFISTEDFKALCQTEGNFFFTQMAFDITTESAILSSFNTSFVILKGGDGIKISKKGEITITKSNSSMALPFKSLVYGINYEMATYSATHEDTFYIPIYISCFNSLLNNLVDAEEVTKKSDDKLLFFYNNINIDSIKGKTLIIDKTAIDIANYNTQTSDYGEKLKIIYSKDFGIPEEKIIILNKVDINKSFASGNKDYIYSLSSIVPVFFDYKGKNLVRVNQWQTYLQYRKLEKGK